MFQFLLELDGEILLWIQNLLRSNLLTPVMVFITTLGNDGAIWILLSLGLLIPKKTRRIGVMMLLSLGVTFLIDNVLLKNLVARIRPYEAINGLERLVEKQKDFSFPSGHAGSAFAAAVILYLGAPGKYGIPAMAFAFLISFSRLYVGVHYPSDVLCGALFGTVIAVIVYKIAQSVKWKKDENTIVR